jgi:DNA-binding Lrp family transcriptional regulator
MEQRGRQRLRTRYAFLYGDLVTNTGNHASDGWMTRVGRDGTNGTVRDRRSRSRRTLRAEIQAASEPGRGSHLAEYHPNGEARGEHLDWHDPVVRRLLVALVGDARRDTARLAELTGIPEDQVAQLVRQLERQRVIRGYKTVVDWERLGDDRVVAFIEVSVSPQREVGFDQVAARIYRYPEVRSVHLISGGHDLRVVVEAPTMREIAQFVSEKLAPIEHVTATNTHFLLKAYKEDGDVLVDDVATDDRLPVTP